MRSIEFAFADPVALKVINRDWELLEEPRRREISARRAGYLGRGMAILRELDGQGRAPDALHAATNLLLAMLNGIATRPFLPAAADVPALAADVTALFLHGFLNDARGGRVPRIGQDQKIAVQSVEGGGVLGACGHGVSPERPYVSCAWARCTPESDFRIC